MKKFLTVILVMIAAAIDAIAQESTGNTSIVRVGLEVTQSQSSASSTHRAPMHINIEAFYNEESETLEICYDGETDGEAFLYLNGNVIGYDSDINTSFQISASGLYTIEVIGDSWIATGYIQI